MQEVAVELSRVLITEYSDQQVIYLREKGGDRTFPIGIGIAEAMAIDRRLKGIETPRPMTHELLANVIETMGGHLERIVVTDLRQLGPDDSYGTFIATLHIRRGSEMLEVDSRPSDAIALGVAFDTPLYVAEHVLAEASTAPSSRQQRIEMLRRRMEILGVKMEEVSERLADEQFLAEAPEEMVDQHRRLLEEMQAEHDAIADALDKYG